MLFRNLLFRNMLSGKVLARTMTQRFMSKLILLGVGLCCALGVVAEDDRRANLPVYTELQPTFVINYVGYTDRLKYLKTAITLRAENIEGDTLVEANMPLVRDVMVMYLSSRNVEQVTGAVAREELRKESIVNLNRVLKEETGQEPIIDVLFTSFVTQ